MRKSRTKLEAVAKIESELAAQPLVSDESQQANAVIEAHENNADNEAVQRKLAERNLPNLEEHGRLVAKHTLSRWKLNRTRVKLQRKIDRFSS